MNAILPLIRRQFIESRWTLGLTGLALFAWGVLDAWNAHHFEGLLSGATELSERDARGLGFLRGFGGPAMDYSTIALEVCWWNHPFVVLIILGWAIARGSGAVSGEIERGTIDVTLSRPVSRSTYLLSQVVFALTGLAILVALLILGCLCGSLFFTLKSPPGVLTLLKPGAIVFTVGMAIFGYTLPFSTIDVSRWRPALVSAGITLAGLIAMGLALLFPRFSWIENLSVYQLYAPVTVAVKGEPLAYNATMLTLVFAVGLAVSFWAFLRRDLPSNS